MAITQTASRVRVESSAKNGTLGAQGVLNADQILFDTAITTNNGNLESTPIFRKRHVTLRRGEVDEEHGLIQSVEVDGLTCNMFDDWDVAPASGDAYDVAYRLEDMATVAGCDFESDSLQFVMTKRLIIGITTTTYGYLGMSHGQILRLSDEGPSQSAFRINAAGSFAIGTMKNNKSERGGVLVFFNDADDELVMDFNGAATGRLYEFALISAVDNVNGLLVTVSGTADMDWGRAQAHGVNAPFKKRVSNIKDIQATEIGTVADVKTMAFWNGWCHSETDESVVDALVGEAATNRVFLLIEDA